MERHSPILIFALGSLPRGVPDLIAIVIVALTGLQTFGQWIFVPLSVLPIVLAAQATTLRRENEFLGLLAYGTSHHSLIIRSFLRGSLIAAFAVLPFILQPILLGQTVALNWAWPITIVSGGVAYAIPSDRRVRSTNFAGLYKG